MPALTSPFYIHFLILMLTQILGLGCAETSLDALWEAFLSCCSSTQWKRDAVAQAQHRHATSILIQAEIGESLWIDEFLHFSASEMQQLAFSYSYKSE